MRRRPHLKEIYGSVRVGRLQQWNYDHKQMFAGTSGSPTGDRQWPYHTASAPWPGVHEPADLRSLDLDGIGAVSVTIGSDPRPCISSMRCRPMYGVQGGRWIPMTARMEPVLGVWRYRLEGRSRPAPGRGSASVSATLASHSPWTSTNTSYPACRPKPPPPSEPPSSANPRNTTTQDLLSRSPPTQVAVGGGLQSHVARELGARELQGLSA